MTVSVESISTLGRRMKISVPDATIEAKIKVKMAKLGKEVRLKGFRPHKIPPKVLQEKFGESVRYEVIEDAIRQALDAAIKENALQLAGLPTIEEINNKSGENLEFTAAFEIFPEIVLQDLSALTIEKKVVDIKDTDVQNTIVKLRDQLADWEVVTQPRPIQVNDKIIVDFARLLKEEGAKKEEQKNVAMIVGVEGILPGLSEALLGKNVNESIEGEFHYPDNWPDKMSCGKATTLWVTVHTIEEKKPLTDEEFAKKMRVDDITSEEFLTKIRDNMEKELQVILRDELKEVVLAQLLEQYIFEVPVGLIQQEEEAIRREANAEQKEIDEAEITTEAKQRVQLDSF